MSMNDSYVGSGALFKLSEGLRVADKFRWLGSKKKKRSRRARPFV